MAPQSRSVGNGVPHHPSSSAHALIAGGGRDEPRHRQAWAERDRLLAGSVDTGHVQHLLAWAVGRSDVRRRVAEAAQALEVHVRSLARRCRRAVGYPPGVLLGLARIAAVARALESTSEPINRIAERLGYPDVPTMSRQFRRYVGLTPTAYRAGIAARDEPSRPGPASIASSAGGL